MELRVLGPDDAEAFFRHRREALATAPMAFSASVEDDRAASPEAVRELLGHAPDPAVLGAFDDDGRLVGAVGVYRETKRKLAHKARIWGLYVAPSGRGRGVGRRLLDAAIAHARALEGVLQVHLSVTDGAPEARRLYESRGFRLWGTEPRSLRHDGDGAAEHHLVLRLDDP